MKLLLDTQLLPWAAGQRERVWKGGGELVLDGEVAGREAVAEDAAHG